jgi:hypothetical protein
MEFQAFAITLIVGLPTFGVGLKIADAGGNENPTLAYFAGVAGLGLIGWNLWKIAGNVFGWINTGLFEKRYTFWFPLTSYEIWTLLWFGAGCCLLGFCLDSFENIGKSKQPPKNSDQTLSPPIS